MGMYEDLQAILDLLLSDKIEYVVGQLPSVDMVRLTHTEMKKRLKGMTLLDENGISKEVPVSFSRPEEWLVTRATPSVNINAISSRVDKTRFTTDKLRAYKSEAKDILLEKPHPLPVTYIYEIRFIVSYGQHMMSLNDQILRRFPPYGFNTYIEIPFGDEVIECPFELIDEKEIFARYGETEDNREFERLYRYTVDSWLDIGDATELKTALSVGVDFDTSYQETEE